MKGYLTVFLALSLSALTGFVMLLTGSAIRNGEKVRFEGAVDVSLNSTLAEYHVGLLERYDLFYIDTSYLKEVPANENLEKRIQYYLTENMNLPWGRLITDKVEVGLLESAAADGGMSMRNQAISYVLNQGESVDGQWKVLDEMDEIRRLENQNPMEGWQALMEQISAMELPKIQKEDGTWEEVALSNPADSVYALSGSDIFYLAEAELGTLGEVNIQMDEYISHRVRQNVQGDAGEFLRNDSAFLTYLFEKMGYLRNPQSSLLLSCQLEYAACGKPSDWENVRAVGEKLFRWRFADNLSCAMSDGDLRRQAEAAANVLQAVQLCKAFKEPVVQSILYACAFLESVNDMRVLYEGGEVPVRKASHSMSVMHVLNGNRYRADTGEGLSYKEYLAGMMLLLDDEILNLRVLDVMEMEMRILDGNPNFAMDWCIERYDVKISVVNNFGDEWSINRRYGYY